jgi:hypothetical protein
MPGTATSGAEVTQRPTENHLHWPQLDIDLSVESLRDPKAFPLVSKTDV